MFSCCIKPKINPSNVAPPLPPRKTISSIELIKTIPVNITPNPLVK
jgi:hypothetical protein